MEFMTFKNKNYCRSGMYTMLKNHNMSGGFSSLSNDSNVMECFHILSFSRVSSTRETGVVSSVDHL